MNEELVILVDKEDNEVGVREKMEAHRLGLLHRAFSIFIFNSRGEILLQKRAKSKYHSGGLWSNTCCSHPRPGENLAAATTRRLEEEMGMTTELKPIFDFQYYAKLDQDLIEHELDHVFIGFSDELPLLNPAEVENYEYLSPQDLKARMISHPDKYTAWLKICFAELMQHIEAAEGNSTIWINNLNNK